MTNIFELRKVPFLIIYSFLLYSYIVSNSSLIRSIIIRKRNNGEIKINEE